MILRRHLTLITLSILCPFLYGQGTYIPLWYHAYHYSDRLEVKSGFIDSAFHSGVKPYDRMSLQPLFRYMPSVYTTRSDEGNFEHLISGHKIEMKLGEYDSDITISRKPVLKKFYKYKSSALYIEREGFDLIVNPVASFSMGFQQDVNELKYVNTRGLELRGTVDSKIGFYSYLADNQAQLPEYVKSKVRTEQMVPHEGFYKVFKDSAGVDFLSARGYFTFHATPHIGIQFGQDRNFIGSGFRSLFLSDHSPAYLFLKANLKVWRINYLNIFAQLTGQHLRWGPDVLRPVKYAAFHHLSINLARNLNIGFFEAVIFPRSGWFEPYYLNPVIFYRSVEQGLGSYDNAFIGADMKANLVKKISLYGQVLLDELNFAQLRDSAGWWGNKFGFQAGVKYFDAAGVKNLDLQVESNTVMPYTYSHLGTGNYTHYNQPLAHPLGANFSELIAIIRYQPRTKLFLEAKAILAGLGSDTTGSDWIQFNSNSTNWGGNIFLPYTTREREYGNKLGQGYKTQLLYLEAAITFELKHNLFIDLRAADRSFDISGLAVAGDDRFFSLGLRMNAGHVQYLF